MLRDGFARCCFVIIVIKAKDRFLDNRVAQWEHHLLFWKKAYFSHCKLHLQNVLFDDIILKYFTTQKDKSLLGLLKYFMVILWALILDIYIFLL